MSNFISEISDWFKDKKKIMAITHVKPDGDALGSLFGLSYLMNANGKTMHTHLECNPPELYMGMSELTTMKSKQFVGKEMDLSSYDGVVILDAARRIMPSLKNAIDIANKHGVPVLVIDHHADNELYGDLNVVEPYCATAAIIADFALKTELKITKEAATCLLLGMMRDTGGFRFQNTDAKTLRITADLMELGGDYHGLTHKIFFSQDLNRLKFISFVINNKLNFTSNGRVLHAILEDEDFSSFGVHKMDMEGLIDSIRAIKGVVITCVFTYFREQVKLSLRSCDEKYPVDEIAHKIGGGGHRLAAGARMDSTSFTPAVSKFLNITGEMFNG